MTATRVLHPSPIKSVGMAVTSAVISVLCFRFWLDGLEYGWIAGSFLAVGAVFYTMHLVPSAYALTLTGKDFEIMELYARKRYVWSEVSEFLVNRGILGASVEFFHYPDGTTLPSRVKLNESFGYRPYMLVALLNEWRTHAQSQTTNKNIWRSDNTEDR